MNLKLILSDETVEVSDYIGFCLYDAIATLIKEHIQLLKEFKALYGVEVASEQSKLLDLEESMINDIALTIDKEGIDIVTDNYLLSEDEKKYYRKLRGDDQEWCEGGGEGDFNEEMDVSDLEDGFEGDWDLYNETMEPY